MFIVGFSVKENEKSLLECLRIKKATWLKKLNLYHTGLGIMSKIIKNGIEKRKG
jgi:hypothetical protein